VERCQGGASTSPPQELVCSFLIYPPAGVQWSARPGGLLGGFPNPAKLICMGFAKNGLPSSQRRNRAPRSPRGVRGLAGRRPQPRNSPVYQYCLFPGRPLLCPLPSHIPTGRGAVVRTARRALGWISQSRISQLYGIREKWAPELAAAQVARGGRRGLAQRPRAQGSGAACGGRAARAAYPTPGTPNPPTLYRPPYIAPPAPPEAPTLHLPSRPAYPIPVPRTWPPGRPPCTAPQTWPPGRLPCARTRTWPPGLPTLYPSPRPAPQAAYPIPAAAAGLYAHPILEQPASLLLPFPPLSGQLHLALLFIPPLDQTLPGIGTQKLLSFSSKQAISFKK
jgi:hypothetical protein